MSSDGKASLDGIARFVTTLRVHLNVPFREGINPKEEPERHAREDAKRRAWLASINQCVRPYTDDILDRTAAAILNTRRGDRRFPLPGEIREIANEIVENDRRGPLLKQAVAEAFDGKSAPRASRARTMLVLDLLRGAMGQQAAREMWIGSLVDYVRDEKELPPAHLVGTIKARAKEFSSLREQCHAGVGWPSTPGGMAMAAACAKWGDTIEARNRLWARVILGQESEEALFRWIEKTDDLADRSVAA